jgi:hypothetical protein
VDVLPLAGVVLGPVDVLPFLDVVLGLVALLHPQKIEIAAAYSHGLETMF